MTAKKRPEDILPTGRPTKYKQRYCQELIDFMSRAPYTEVEEIGYDKAGNERISIRRVANDPPFIAAFARKIDIATVTLYQWAQDHPEFTNALARARELQLEFIAINGMNGLFNAQFTKFAAQNLTSWRDKQEIEHRGNISLSSRMSSVLSDNIDDDIDDD